MTGSGAHPITAGAEPYAFRDLAAAFDAQFDRGLHYGAQLAVWIDGSPAFARVGGYADRAGSRPIGLRTPFMVYSVTKSIVAVAVHMLADRGALDLDAPVRDRWPGFGAKGKDGITPAHLLSHLAGIPANPGPADAVSWLAPRWSARRVEAMPLEFEPGSKCVYLAFTAHVALGELIRRVDGRSPARFIREEIFAPLGMADSLAGVPVRRYREVSGIHSGDRAQDRAAATFGNPLMRSVFMPAASVNTTATDLCRLYDALLCPRGGARKVPLSATALGRATRKRYEGPDGDTGRLIRWSEGFTLGGLPPFPHTAILMMGKRSTETTFGHAGQGGCALAWADPETRLVFAFVCNRFLPAEEAHRRFQELSDLAWDAPGRRGTE